MNNETRECCVQIWHAKASTESPGPTEVQCESMMLEDERDNADRFRRSTTRNQHVIGRGMARRLLGSEQVGPHEIRFAHGEQGKPFVTEPAKAKQPFNVAHTDGLVICGIGPEQTVDLVGVDVECVDRRTSTDLAERYFSPPEVEMLRSRPTSEQKQFFLRIWTLKEAFIKAIGTGLHTPLADFAFHDIESDNPVIEFLSPSLEDSRSWQFFCFEPRAGYVAASAVVPQAGFRAKIDCIPFENLLSGG